jgi:hypothetical protein
MDFWNCGCTAGYVWGWVLGWDRGANVRRGSFSRTRTRLRGKGLKSRHRAKERKRWICGGVEGAPYRRAKRDVGVWAWSAGDRLAGGHFAPVGPPAPVPPVSDLLHHLRVVPTLWNFLTSESSCRLGGGAGTGAGAREPQPQLQAAAGAAAAASGRSRGTGAAAAAAAASSGRGSRSCKGQEEGHGSRGSRSCKQRFVHTQ